MRLDLVTPTKPDYRLLSHAIRFLSMDAVEKAKSGHPGLPLGMADVATVLFQDFIRIDPSHPNWMNRDRFVLSAGHGSMLLYSLLYLCGYPNMSIEEIKNFRQLGSLTPGHPEFGHTPGVETTTGPLGQGLANAVGMAISERMLNARYGNDIIDHYIYVIASDGDLMEGISQEAISLAGHLKLKKLIVFFDDNHITIDGSTDLSTSDNQLQRFSASGWHVQAIDGHDYAAIHHATQAAQESDRPSMIACRTEIAHGAATKAGTHHAHGAPLGAEEIKTTREKLGWNAPEFVVPEDILLEWRIPGQRGQKIHEAWKKKFETLSPEDKKALNLPRKEAAKLIQKPLEELRHRYLNEKPTLATRVLSQQVLEEITHTLPHLVGGSADLTGSNNTKSKAQEPITPSNFSGRYIYYGIREHAMAAAMNGISVHGPLIPYGGTFLVFSDYLRPSLRLSALMERPVIYVLTHDSIGLGEDGPTHQPIEHLSALRSIPNVYVLRPADSIEVTEAWEIAIESEKTPSVLALTRQNLPTLREEASENLSKKGAYILSDAEKERQVTLIASGSEVSIAMEAKESLKQQGIHATVVSMPCLDLFEAQDHDYIQKTLGSAPRIFIEAAAPQSLYQYMRQDKDGIFLDHLICMKSFGASAPIKELYYYFGITSDHIKNKVFDILKN